MPTIVSWGDIVSSAISHEVQSFMKNFVHIQHNVDTFYWLLLSEVGILPKASD